MDIRAKLAALKNAGKSPADSKTPARSGANAFGRMMEGGAPFTFPESTPWPTDENMGDVSSKIKDLKDKAGAIPTTSSSITQGDGSSAGNLVFGGKKRDQQPADINIGQPGDLVFGGKKDESTTTRKAADQVLREAEELAGAKDAGFLKGVASGFDAVDTFTAGLAKSSRKNAQVLTTRNIEKKIKAGLPLSNDEQLFVDAVGLRQKADELLEQSGGKSIGYQVGNVTGAMPEFIAQIAMTKGVGDGVGTTMKAIPFIKEGLKAGALKKGTTLAGIELGKAAVVSPLQPMFASAFADQELGQYYVGTDENGEVVAERNNPQSVTASLAKAFAYTLTENWSEGMGEIFGQAGTKLAQGVAKSKLGVRLAGSQLGSLVAKTEETVAKVTGSMGTKADDFGLGGVRAFTKDVLKWNGTLNEIAEEEFNNVVQPLLMGEPEQLKQLIDPEQQLVTALSCAVAGVGFKAIEVPGYVKSGIAIKQNKEAYQESLANLRPEIASQVVAAFGEQDIAARGKALAALPWMDMQPAEREQVVNAAYHKTKYDFLRGAKSASEAEEKLSSIKQKVDYFSFKGVHNFEPSLYAATLDNGVPVTIVDGDIQSYTNADNSTLYLAGKNRKPVVVTADGRRLMVDPIQLNGISRISSAEYTNASIDQFLQQQAVEDDTNDINDAEEDMQVASLQPMLPAAPISEQQATPEIQTTPQQPIAETNTNNDYIPKVSDTVVTPNGYVGKVVQSNMDGAIVSYLDENGDEQIEVVGPNDPIQPYQPAEDELQPAPANLVNDGNGNISQYQPVEDEKEPTISKMETAEVLPVETSSRDQENDESINSNTEQQATTETEADTTVQEEAVVAPSYPELAKEISNTVNDEPSVEEPHYVSKNRKYLYTFKNGSLLIMDRNGIEIPPVINGRINQQHTRLSKEYKNVFDYSKGEEGTADGATSEAEAILMLINSSKNPLELANLYLSETARGNDLVRDMEVSVVGVILDVAQSHKVSKDGFEEWSDANNISGTIAKTFFSKDGVNPSDIAALANAQLKGEWDANNEMVTANDVVQAIIDYPRGVQDLERVIKDGTAAKAAHDAFIGITGFAITPSVINRIAAYQTEETPSILSEEELQQQMADDEWQARIDAAKQAGIDMAAEQYGLFLEPTLQQNENSNVEQESNISNDELPSTQGTESENTINTTEVNNSGEQEGDQGIIQQPEEPNQQEVGLSPTQQSEYDKRKLEIEREITDLTDKLSAARKSKDKAINEAQMRNGLFGDTATDPRQTTIDGGGTLDVLSGVNTISKKHSETISHLSKDIQAKKKELDGLLGAISSQQEIQPQDELIVQNHTTSSSEPTVEEDDKNLAVQNHTTNPEFTFPLERVVKAYSHLHLNPRNSALVERDQLNTIINKLSEAITNHNPNINSEELSSILDNFKHRYVERRERVWNSAQNSYSSAVAGASNFNKRQADKRGSILDREEDSFNKWLNEEVDKVEFAQGIDRKAEQQQKEQQKQEKAQARKVMVVKAWLMLKPGDTVDIGNPSGNPTIKKKNKFSLETNSGVKWTLKQITGIDHEEAKTIMDQIEADNTPLTTTAENNESINSEQATTEETPAATPEEQETPIVAIGSEEAVRKEQEEAFRAKFPLYFKTASSIEKMYNGELTLDEYKQAFKQLQDDKDKIVAELNGNTKDTILRLLGPYERFQYKNDKKENIVNNIYRNLLMNYAFNTISYDFRTTTDVAIANKVEKTTQEQLNSFVDDVRKQREEYIKEQELKKKALENPETAEEFRIFISKNGIDALNNEQLAAWDKIVTQNALNNKESKKAKTAKPEAVAISTNGMSLHETKHTKTGEQLFVVQLPERVSKEEYQAFNSRAKSLGGYYSSYRGNGAIPGFTFKNKSNAEEFMGNTESKTDNEEAQDTTTPSAQKLKELGEKVVENANEALNRDRLTNTVKRAREAEYAEKNARILLRLGQTIINIANGIEAENVNLLKNIKAKTHVEMLESILGSAKWRHYDDIKKNSSYKDREETLKADPTEEVIRYVKNEYFPRLYKDNLLRMVRSAINVKGMKMLASRLEKSLLSVNSEYVTIKNEQQLDDIMQVVNSLPEKDRISVIEDQLARHRRLKAMGVENESMLREMLREYLNYRAGAIKQDEVKRLERELVGKNVGIDFFPTPKSTVERMVDEADIREGMDVLEPSAGNGNIADGIRETGVEPDVIEISGALSKVLEAKGYNVVGGDFMDYNEKQYDRIVMNPPFSNSMDAEHIMHAYELLKPGGRIVAISGEGIFFRSDKKSVEFRDWLDSVGGYSEKLPEGTFTDKKLLNTTGVNSRLVIVDKLENISDPNNRSTYSRRSVTEASEAVKEAKDTAAKLYDSIAETSDSISSQYSVMQHLDGTAQNAIIEAVEPLVKQWSEAENKKQDAVGVLIQERRIKSELERFTDLISLQMPEGGWDANSVNDALQVITAVYPNTSETIAINGNSDAYELLTSLGYSEELVDEVVSQEWNGVTMPDGRILINTSSPEFEFGPLFAHEQAHAIVRRMFSPAQRMRNGESICNAIGVQEILSYIGTEYANDPIWIIGEEYVTHKISNIVRGKEAVSEIPATVSELTNITTDKDVNSAISTILSMVLKRNNNGRNEDYFVHELDRGEILEGSNRRSVSAVFEANRTGKNKERSLPDGELHQERVAAAEDLTDTNPSDAQKIAGNYRKGKSRVLGMEISIENPKGSTRSGVDPNGKAWSITMPQPYGYILGTVGKDKDHVDVYLGRNLTKDTPVFIVNQVNPSTGAFDEHKVMIGYPTYGSAKRAYMSAYEQGWQGFGSIGVMSLDEFKEWAYSNKTKKEATPTEPTPELADSPEFSSTWHDDDFLGMPTDFGSAIAFARRRGGDVRRPDKNMSLLDGTFDKVREQIQDATLRVRKLQERIEQSGGKVPFAANAWEALNRYTSAAKAKMDYFENGELNNLITVAGDLCKKVDATWEQLNDYLMCKHGIDRQEVGDVNVFSTVAGSEWTLSNAQQTVKDFESKTTTEDIDKLWLAVREATTASLKALKDGGVISENDMNGYLSREGWQNYVPLRDFDVTDEMKADDVFEYSESRNPQRGTFVKATQTAKGRTSKPNSPIPQIAAMFASSVALAEKNRAKQALLNLVRLNPKREEYTVTRSWYVLDKGTNTTLEVYEKPKPSLIDLQSACIDFFIAPDIQSKNAMVQQLQDMQQAAIDDGADPNLVGLVMRQGMKEGAYTITTKPHKSSILGETKEQDSKHMVAVFEDGVKYVIWMQDYKLAEAVNHKNINEWFSKTWVGSIMSAMTRWLSVNFTGKNPAFIPINWIRDMQYATLSHLIRHDGETARTYANIVRASMAIHRFNTGNANPLSDEELAGYSMHNPNHMLYLIGTYGKNRIVDTLFMQYRNNGGETGYIHTDDIRTWAKRLRRHLQREMGTNPTVDKLKQAGSKYTGLHAAGRLLDYTAYQSENMTRFATFLAAWESGKGFAEAASDAKNITVNFNRKGRISSILNSIMVFFNATVQGTDNLIDRVIVPNKGRFATAASILFAASILASSMAIAAYGDGDDSPYWRMPEFVRYNSLLVPTYGIGGDEKFLIIPLPPGLRFINGWAAASLEGYYGKKRASEVASAMASSLFDNTSPVGVNGGDLTRTFIPSIAVPFYDIAINKDYAGRPVYREMFTQELRDNTPNSQQGSRDVNEAFAGFAQWLNELGGGDENLPAGVDRSTGKLNKLKRALLDINPSKIEHVLSYYAGGRGQFFLDCYRTARPTWDSNAELETRNIPVVRRLWGGATAASDAKAFYDRVDNLKRYQYYIDKSFKDGDRKGINESLVNLDVYRWAAMSEAYSEQVRDLSRMADGKSITKDQRKELLERRKLLMRQFLNSTNNYDKITEKLANNE